MIFSRHLLSQFIDVSALDFDEVCVRLSSIGLEVESSSHLELPSHVVVGKILDVSPHPDADKLNVCQVSIGSQELQIVCGASNVAKEQYVALALEGAIIPHTKNGALTIKRTNLRGVESYGMLCSSTELGLPKLNDGIMILDHTAGKLVLGEEIKNLPLFNDYIIEVAITPNRGDCLSVFGIARELAAIYDLRFRYETDMDNVITLGLGRVLQILTDKRVQSQLLYRVIEVKQARLPLDIALTLARNGTLGEDIVGNYLEYGTYMSGVILNAYKLRDCESKDTILDNGLIAQLYVKKDERGLESIYAQSKLSTIGIEHGKRHFGTRSEVLIIEASYVKPTILAQSMHTLGIKGESTLTYRTTRGSNPNLEQGIDFICKKMVDTSDVLVYSGSHNISHHTDETSIKTTFGAINTILGTNLDKEQIAIILKKLDFKLDATCDENFFMISVPHYRHDIESIQDVAEEVLRIYGIDNVQSIPLQCTQTHNANESYFAYKAVRELAHRLIANGFKESIHYLFTERKNLQSLGFVSLHEELDLLNPITSELDTLRTSMLPSMLLSIKRNENLGYKSIALFEIGSVYDCLRNEKNKLAMIASGSQYDECYPHAKSKKWDFYSFASVLEHAIGNVSFENLRDTQNKDELLARFGFLNENILHPYQSAFVFIHGNPIGIIAKLHPQIAHQLEINDCYICEIELDIAKSSPKHAQEFSKYQKSLRDLTLVLQNNIPFHHIRKSLLNAKIPFIKQLYPLDVYHDESLGENVALSIRFVLQSEHQTLQESQMAKSMQRVLQILAEEFGATLRA